MRSSRLLKNKSLEKQIYEQPFLKLGIMPREPYLDELWFCEDASGVYSAHIEDDLRSRLAWSPQQVIDAYHVVHRKPELEHPPDAIGPTMTCLAHQSNSLQPSENLFDFLPLPLADRIAFVTGCPCIDSTRSMGRVLCNMRRYLQSTQVGDKLLGVIQLVGSHGRTMVAAV